MGKHENHLGKRRSTVSVNTENTGYEKHQRLGRQVVKWSQVRENPVGDGHKMGHYTTVKMMRVGNRH